MCTQMYPLLSRWCADLPIAVRWSYPDIQSPEVELQELSLKQTWQNTPEGFLVFEVVLLEHKISWLEVELFKEKTSSDLLDRTDQARRLQNNPLLPTAVSRTGRLFQGSWKDFVAFLLIKHYASQASASPPCLRRAKNLQNSLRVPHLHIWTYLMRSFARTKSNCLGQVGGNLLLKPESFHLWQDSAIKYQLHSVCVIYILRKSSFRQV